MSFALRKDGDKWAVVNKDTGKIHGRTRSRKKAVAFMRALYANVPDAGKALDPGAMLVGFGGTVKAMDDSGRIEGDLVVFGSPDETDLSKYRDFFTKATDYGRAIKTGGLDLIYHHALPYVITEPNPLADRVLADVEVKADEARVWITGQLALRDKYEQMVFEAVKAGKMGLSSGADPARVRRQRQDNGSHKVLAWHIVHASITPTPADPRTWIQSSIKSLDEFDPAGAAALKSLIDGSEAKCYGPYSAEDEPALAALMAGLSRLGDAARSKVGQILADKTKSGADKLAAVRGRLNEQTSIGLKLVEALMEGAADDAAVKSLLESFGSDESPIEQDHDAPESGASMVERLHRAVSDLDWASGQRNLNATKSAAIDVLTAAVRRYNASRIDEAKVRSALELANRLLTRSQG